MKKSLNKKHSHRKNYFSCINLICWIVVPFIIAILLILDGTGIYAFNTERLIVIGAFIVVILLPFFNEVTVKDFSLKKEDSKNQNS